MTTSTPDAAAIVAANEPLDSDRPRRRADRQEENEVQDARHSVSSDDAKARDAVPGLAPEVIAFYQDAMRILQRAAIPFMAGGAYALRAYTGITRHTKDFDIFLLPDDIYAALAAFHASGYETKMQADYWLAKVYDGDAFVDLIFGSGNGVARVDEVWLEHAPEAEVFGMRVKLIPPEEMIWSKSFIMERERYDGADIAHVLLRCADQLDWRRLYARFGENWRVLLTHLVLFGFVYPSQRNRVPAWLMDQLLGLARSEAHTPIPDERVCNGTMLSRQQYLVDVCDWGFADGRLIHGYMSPEQIEEYTAAIHVDGNPQDQERLRQLEHELHEKLAGEKPAPTFLDGNETR